MIELSLNHIEKYFGATKVLNDVTFSVQTTEKVGIVGGNGSGKSTILKIIEGIEKQDGGMVFIKKGATIGYLDQIPSYTSTVTVLDVLNSAFEKQFKLQEALKNLELKMSSLLEKELEFSLKEYGEMLQKFELSGGYTISEKLNKICTGLKLNKEFQNRFFQTLSGGEKTTVILSKILLQSPDILLLDEPSNHLDMESMEWLEAFLKEYKGIALIVSHDRYFLDQVVTKIIEVEDMNTETYIGNYSAYVKTKETNMLLQFDAYEDQQKKIKAMEKAIKDLRDWAIRADNNKFFRRAESMQKRLDKLQKIEKPVLERPTIQLQFSSSSRSGKDVIRIKDLVKKFNDTLIFSDAALHVRYGERVSIIGNNGTGKSTLLKILLKEYSADNGIIELGAGLRIGYLPQEVIFDNEELSVLECFRENIHILEGKSREYLSKFLFYGESVFKTVKKLSGGEKSRLKLAQLMYEDINFLILDEPTNHLDIDSRESLEEALAEFKDTILFISHDRYFINNLCTRIVELSDRKFSSYDGNYEYYKEKKSENKIWLPKEEQQTKPMKEKTSKQPTIIKKNEFIIQKLETDISHLESTIQKYDEDMERYCTDGKKLNELFLLKGNAEEELTLLLEKWVNM